MPPCAYLPAPVPRMGYHLRGEIPWRREQAARKVYYADQNALTRAIVRKYPPAGGAADHSPVKGEGQLHDAPVQEMGGGGGHRL